MNHITDHGRFALFQWNDHEAIGGWNDFFGYYNVLEDAIADGKKWESEDPNWHCWHVADLWHGKIEAGDDD